VEIERWHPVTRDMGLIQLPVATVVSALTAWHEAIGIHYRHEEITTSLGDSLARLAPLSAEKRRRLFVSTASGWTACFQSGIDGSDPFPAMSYLAQQRGVVAMRVCCAPPGARWPAVIWETYAPQALGGDPLSIRRSIAAANDGGRWVFSESGAPFPFEDVSRYRLPKKRDRFSRDQLGVYLREFGLEPWSDDFYQVRTSDPAILLERQRPRRGQTPQSSPEFSLEQVLAGAPWQR
jgi:hypothetical protein